MEYRIPFNKILPDWPETDCLAMTATQVIESGHYILGPEVKKFETALENHYGAFAVGVANGTDALEALIRVAMNRRPGRNIIITVGNAGRPPISAIKRAGCQPLYCEVGIDGLMDPEWLRKTLFYYKDEILAIMPVHLYGQYAPMEEIQAIARERDIYVIEDGAQSFGSQRFGKTLPYSLGMGLSFYPTKSLGGLGDGGAIITQHSDVAAELRKMRFYGEGDDYGMNSRLDEIQAAFLSYKLFKLNLTKRRALAKRYYQRISKDLLHRPFEEFGNYHLFTVIVKDRERVRKALEAKGIQTLVHYPFHGKHPELLPMTAYLCNSVLSLPMYDTMTEEQVDEVADALHGACYHAA